MDEPRRGERPGNPPPDGGDPRLADPSGEVEIRARAVLRLLAGEPVAALAGEGVGSVEELEAWRGLFVRAGREALAAAGGAGEAAGSEPWVRVSLLGHPLVEVVRGGEAVEVGWPLKRSLELVAFLALSPGFKAGKGEIVEALWSEAREDQVEKNFHPTLSLARRALGRALGREARVVRHGQGLYGLDPEIRWSVDALVFEAGVERGRRLAEREASRREACHEWRAAWRLYRGPLLQGHEEAWLLERRERLYQGYVAMLRHLGALYAELGCHPEALDAYRALLVVEPLEEQIHGEVMAIYALQGRRDLVRRQFVRLQELLKELHVEPMEETQERYHALMR